MAIQELRLKTRVIQLSLAFSHWQRKAALVLAAEQQTNALQMMKTEQEGLREQLRADMTSQLETSRGEVCFISLFAYNVLIDSFIFSFYLFLCSLLTI